MAKVLIGGERSGVLRDAFLRHGHDAMSCDLVETQAPGPHYVGDWREVWGAGWDLGVFHPTCTYMTNSSSKHLYIDGKKENGLNEERVLGMMRAAWDVWSLLQDCPIPAYAVENPVMLRYAQTMSELDKLPKQVVQPWWFGTDPDGPDNVKKATCWWRVGGLPPLVRTGTLDGTTARPEVHSMGPTSDPEERRMARSRFHPGHADAIAGRWGYFAELARVDRLLDADGF